MTDFAPNEVTAVIDGTLYHGWKDASVNKGFGSLAGDFILRASDRWPGQPAEWGIKMGADVLIQVNGEEILRGWVEDVPTGYDATQHDITFSGRDKLCDLVDCSHLGPPNEWHGQQVRSIAAAICQPFGIAVAVDQEAAAQASKVVPEYKANEGDAALDLLNRVCQAYAVLPVSYGDGRLTLTQAGARGRATDAIRLGWNAKRAQGKQSNRDRYSLYVVRGQGLESDDASLEDITEPEGRETDTLIARYRPLVIVSERATDTRTARDQARWEARVRAGRSRSIPYDVYGWVQSDGRPWQINMLVKVEDDRMGVNDWWLISDLKLRTSDDGNVATITVEHPAAYELIATGLPPAAVKTAFDSLGL